MFIGSFLFLAFYDIPTSFSFFSLFSPSSFPFSSIYNSSTISYTLLTQSILYYSSSSFNYPSLLLLHLQTLLFLHFFSMLVHFSHLSCWVSVSFFSSAFFSLTFPNNSSSLSFYTFSPSRTPPSFSFNSFLYFLYFLVLFFLFFYVFSSISTPIPPAFPLHTPPPPTEYLKIAPKRAKDLHIIYFISVLEE
uniref:Uncharacterized protein n=1 Tax=Cacopsylla melanoneura TaxID=428564 RepID=A0A8D8SPJ5_9HEMI